MTCDRDVSAGLYYRLADRALWRGSDHHACLLYTSDAADERSSVDLGGRRILQKKKKRKNKTKKPLCVPISSRLMSM